MTDEAESAKQTMLMVELMFHGRQEGQALPPTRVYLFDQMGKLVASERVRAEGATFSINPERRYRVVAGPDVQGGMTPSNVRAQLAKAKAITQDYIPGVNQERIQITVHPNIWICWWQTCILVHGSVRKLLNPGGDVPQYAPICTGTVQMFQVDLACTLDQLASFTVVTLRDRLIDRLRALPVEATQFSNHTSESVLSTAVLGEHEVARAGSLSMMQAESSAVSSALTSATTTAHLGQSAFSPSDMATTLSLLQGNALKQFLVAQKAILWPFWCELIPDEWFCWQELGEVPIQSDATFSAEVCFWCPSDFPDLYFEVVQNVGGSEREISDPQIACSTYYGYDGSRDVVITVDDPDAVACMPDPNPGPDDLYVWPTAIGNVDLGGIDGLETGVGTGLLSGDTPFGGALSLQMQFHPDLQANNVSYYRWSYKFDDETDFSPIHTPVVHRYQTVIVNPGPPPVIVIQLHGVALGPFVVNGTTNLFQIPDPTLDWVDINDPADRPLAYFDSTGAVLPRESGMCTLLLELFDNTGNYVPCNNTRGSATLGDREGVDPGAGPFSFILPQIGGPPGTYSNAPAPNITDHGRLVFRLRVDNDDTVAALPGVTSPSGSADACGFLHYNDLSDLISIQYVATHPNNFLSWSLWVNRGLAGTVASGSGNTSSPPMSLAWPSTPGSFNNAASALLGTCTRAAFAVNLYCWARAVDGYSRQSQYDSSATIAFALTTT